jgi:RNA polymerase sigma factor (sigma-70 family)
MDKETLIKCCQLGDISSFSELYKLYSKPALGTAYLISGNKCIAEDIVHEAFIQCFQSIKTLKNIETFDVWFYKVVTRTGWRMAKKHKHTLLFEDTQVEDTIADYSAMKELNFCETKLVINEALAKLSLPLRTVIILYYFNDMSIKEISKVLGCFEGTVKSRLHNGKKQLSQIIDEDINGNTFKTEYARKECLSDGE